MIRRACSGRGRMWRASAAIAVVVFVCAGCGGGSTPTSGGSSTASPVVELAGLSADQVLVAARVAANDALSVRFAGNVARDGQRTTLDLRLRRNGDGNGFIETTAGRIDVARLGRDLYFRADLATLTRVLGPDRATKAGTRFVKVPVGDATFRSFRDLLDMDSLFETLLTPKGELSRVDGIPVDGIATVGLRDGDPKTGGVLYVAAAGPPLPAAARAGRCDGRCRRTPPERMERRHRRHATFRRSVRGRRRPGRIDPGGRQSDLPSARQRYGSTGRRDDGGAR